MVHTLIEEAICSRRGIVAISDEDTPCLSPLAGVNAWSPVNGTEFATTAFDRLRILRSYRTIAMVGLSSNPFRPSHFAAIYMLAEGYNVIRSTHASTRSWAGVPTPPAARHPRAGRDRRYLSRPISRAADRRGGDHNRRKGGLDAAGRDQPRGSAARTRGWARGGDGRLRQNRACAFFGGLSTIGLNTGVITARRDIRIS